MARVAVFFALWVALAGCRSNVQIVCDGGLSDQDCQSAASLAEALLGDEWASAKSVSIHDGACSQWMNGCLPQRQRLGEFVTVDVENRDGRRFSISIDRRTEPWSAGCSEFVSRLGGRHTSTEPCALEASSS